MGVHRNTPSEPKNVFNQISSLVVAAMDGYSVSVEERETVVCFFVRQATGEPPSVTR